MLNNKKLKPDTLNKDGSTATVVSDKNGVKRMSNGWVIVSSITGFSSFPRVLR